MLAEFVESLFVLVALVYWFAAFAALIMRLLCPEFATLSSYGVRSAYSTASRDLSEIYRGRKEENFMTAPANHRTHWCAAPVHWLASSQLGRCRVARKQSFTAFYVTGLVTSLLFVGIRFIHNFGEVVSVFSPLVVRSSSAPPLSLTSVPLLLFTLHCAVRLAETRLVQRFRQDDTVTLFAAVAGSTFYLIAAISSSAPIHSHVPSATVQLGRVSAVRCVFAVGAVMHLCLQAIQVTVHTVLAMQQQISLHSTSSSGKAVICDLEEGLWRRVQARLATAGPTSGERLDSVFTEPVLHGAWRRYRYPYYANVCFRVVLDPHYTCEVAMYAVNTILILLCVLRSATPPTLEAAAGASQGVGTHITSGHPPRWGIVSSIDPWLSVLASVGLTGFTAMNLCITSAEHRLFWVSANATRRLVTRTLQAILCEQQTKEPRGCSDQLPREVVDAGVRLLQELREEETLPRWNIFPLVQ